MANRFPGKSCVLCLDPSSGVGEHVWPTWLIKEFHDEGPFTSEKGGTPYTKRDGVTPATSVALPGSHVPMCVECNSHLNRTIEAPAKNVIRRLIPWTAAHEWPALSAAEARSLACWFLKVGLLGAHPEVVHDRPQMDRDLDFRRNDHGEPEWLEWLHAGTAPPYGFSVYVARRNVLGEHPDIGEKSRIILPHVSVEGRSLNYMSRRFGIRGLDVTIAWHPGWPILHPLVEDGRAVQLWPNPSGVDFAKLPEVHPEEFGFHTGIGDMHFTEELFHRAALEPLSVGMDPIAAFFGKS